MATTLHNPKPGDTIRAKRGEFSLVSKPLTWRLVRYDKPHKGEFYLSGAIIEAWQAPNDLSTEYWIVTTA